MGWLNRKLSEIKELREIEKQAEKEEMEIVEAENKRFKIEHAKAVGKERARNRSDEVKYNKKVEKAAERGKKKARQNTNQDNAGSSEMENKILQMWGVPK